MYRVWNSPIILVYRIILKNTKNITKYDKWPSNSLLTNFFFNHSSIHFNTIYYFIYLLQYNKLGNAIQAVRVNYFVVFIFLPKGPNKMASQFSNNSDFVHVCHILCVWRPYIPCKMWALQIQWATCYKLTQFWFHFDSI